MSLNLILILKYIFLNIWFNVKIDNVKCRWGRPKGTKKPFWNFSSAKSKASGKKRKASDDFQNQQKHFKSEDNACNKNSKTVQKDKVIMQNFDTVGKSKDKSAQKEINNVWLKVGKHTLHDNDKVDIENRKMLNDRIIDAEQFLMKKTVH